VKEDTVSAPSSPQENGMPVSDAFGAFGPTEDKPLPTEPVGFLGQVPITDDPGSEGVEELTSNDDEDDDFGDFEAVPDAGEDLLAATEEAAQPSAEHNNAEKALQHQEEHQSALSFGGFDAFAPNENAPLPSSTPPAIDLMAADNKDDDGADEDSDFRDFKEHRDLAGNVAGSGSDVIPVPAESSQEDKIDAFGQFGSPGLEVHAPQEESEGFRGFSAFGAPTPDHDIQPADTPKETFDGFDAFASAEPQEPESIADEKKSGDQPDLFGAFSNNRSPQAPQETTSPPTTPGDAGAAEKVEDVDEVVVDDDDSGDWGAFDGGEGLEQGQVPTSPFENIRSKVAAEGDILSDDFNNISILACLDKNANGDQYRASRCYFICSLLSSTHKNHGTIWAKLIAATKDELLTCKGLLQEMAKDMSRKERAVVANSEQLQTYLQGLREYIRVVRSIVASIGDLQCLHEDIDLNDFNLWLGMDILKAALDVETDWSGFLRAAKKLGLNLDLLSVETVPDMRRRTAKLDLDYTEPDQYSRMVCHLSLQPLSSGASVDWNGHVYMACAANFYANRVSSDAPL